MVLKQHKIKGEQKEVYVVILGPDGVQNKRHCQYDAPELIQPPSQPIPRAHLGKPFQTEESMLIGHTGSSDACMLSQHSKTQAVSFLARCSTQTISAIQQHYSSHPHNLSGVWLSTQFLWKARMVCLRRPLATASDQLAVSRFGHRPAGQPLRARRLGRRRKTSR